ncbi:hypothetical protein IHQ56_17685, partial [Methylobacillus flagellatus]|nr:hypothetical protein [Methylobacillus flagellatus]
MRSDEHSDLTLKGGAGDDAITADGGVGGVFDGGAGNDYLSAGRIGDFEDYPQNNGGRFYGGTGDDVMDGNEANNVTFLGGDGNDVLSSNLASKSSFNGEAGDDFLIIDSPTGQNTYNGGAGIDTAMFEETLDSYTFRKYGQELFVGTTKITGVEYFRFYDAEANQWTEYTLAEVVPDNSVAVEPTGNPYIDALLQGSKWMSPATYTFPGGWYAEGDGSSGDPQGHMLAMRGAYTYVNAITGLTLTEVTRQDEEGYPLPGLNTDMPITIVDDYTEIRSPDEGGGAMIYYLTAFLQQESRAGTRAYLWDLRVVAQTLGLQYGSESGMLSDKDALEYTVMSEISYVGGDYGDTVADGDYPQTFMQLDILALQTLYGADYSYNGGDTVYKW